MCGLVFMFILEIVFCNMQGVGAVVGAISRNLAELRDHHGSYVSIYDQPALSHPVLFRIRYWTIIVSRLVLKFRNEHSTCDVLAKILMIVTGFIFRILLLIL